MKIRSLLLSALVLAPLFASAHPGHDFTALHLHLGIPAASNALDLRLTFGALIVGLLVQAVRAFKRR